MDPNPDCPVHRGRDAWGERLDWSSGVVSMPIAFAEFIDHVLGWARPHGRPVEKDVIDRTREFLKIRIEICADDMEPTGEGFWKTKDVYIQNDREDVTDETFWDMAVLIDDALDAAGFTCRRTASSGTPGEAIAAALIADGWSMVKSNPIVVKENLEEIKRRSAIVRARDEAGTYPRDHATIEFLNSASDVPALVAEIENRRRSDSLTINMNDPGECLNCGKPASKHGGPLFLCWPELGRVEVLEANGDPK